MNSGSIANYLASNSANRWMHLFRNANKGILLRVLSSFYVSVIEPAYRHPYYIVFTLNPTKVVMRGIMKSDFVRFLISLVIVLVVIVGFFDAEPASNGRLDKRRLSELDLPLLPDEPAESELLRNGFGSPGPLQEGTLDMETVEIGDPENPADPATGFGNVDYPFRIGTYEVTNAQYAVFLNAVAATDTHGLYNPQMESDVHGGIVQSGTNGNYSYTTKLAFADRPVNFVSFWDACRFANWLHNGQPVGLQDNSTTETGAYLLNGVTNPANDTIQRTPGGNWAIPSRDEWYKAAYHQPAGNGGDPSDYWDFPTASNSWPTEALIDALGNITNPGPNVANYLSDNSGDTVSNVGTAGMASQSFYGTFDQGGNVQEWTDNIAGATSRKTMGGHWANWVLAMRSDLSDDKAATTELAFWGFRVVRTPFGQTYYYDGPDNGFWSKNTNWDPAFVPNHPTVSAIVDAHQWGGFGAVHDTADYDLPTGQLVELVIGNVSTGQVNMLPGTALDAEIVQLGRNVNAYGFLAIPDTGNTLNVNNYMTVGNLGDGDLDVRGGAAVSSRFVGTAAFAGTLGRITIDGGATEFSGEELLVGQAGTGNLTVSNGATLMTSVKGSIGVASTANGFADITGPGSQWINQDRLYVGEYGHGDLDILDESLVTNTVGQIAREPNSSGNVFVRQSNWINSSQLQIGVRGNGILDVEFDGFVASNGGFVGVQASSTGTATISGMNSIFDAGYIYSGYLGEGTLNIVSGGTVIADSFPGNLAIGAGVFGGSNGVINLNAGNLTSNAYAAIGNSGQGELNILVESNTGSEFLASGTLVGYQPGGMGLVNVTASTMTNTEYLILGGYLDTDGGVGEINVSGYPGVGSARVTVGDLNRTDYVTYQPISNGNDNFSQILVGNSYEDSLLGQLVIRNGSSADSGVVALGYLPGSFGSALVTGLDSQLDCTTILVGGYGTGSITVADQAMVNSFSAKIGASAGGPGTAIITGPGTKWTNANNFFSVGRQATGQVDVLDGAELHVNTSRIGMPGGTGIVNVDGAESRWDHISDVRIGNDGIGEVHLSNGAFMRNDTAFLGYLPNADGTANVDGQGTLWESRESLFIGGDESGTQGTGIVNVTGDATVAVDVNLVVWTSGSLNVDGGHVEATTMIFEPARDPTFSMTSGSINTTGVVANLFEFAGGSVAADRFFQYDTRGPIHVIQNGGTLDPGGTLNPATTVIEGDYTVNGGNIRLELDGLTAGTEHDIVHVTGDLVLNSATLDVRLLDLYTLNDGQQYEIVKIDGAVTGKFNGLDEGGFVGRHRYHNLFISYTGGDGNDIVLFATTVPKPQPSNSLPETNQRGR